MSERAPKRKIDGNITFEGGVDTGKSPSLVSENQVQWAINTTFRGGYASCRPGWTALRDTGITGQVQCATVYVNDQGRIYIIILAAGRVYVWDEQSGSISDISITGDLNPSYLIQGWMVQAENFVIIQDGFSPPLIFDGVTLRRAANDELQTGTVMAYVQGRIWYARPDGYSFRATDLVYSDGTRESVLKETENTFLNEGGDFSVPSDSGGITAIAVPGTLDTALGQGPLLVMTPKYIFAINAPVDRNIWKDVTYPIQSISAVNAGAVGARSTTTINGDVFYRSSDGIRSFIIARRDFNTWGNTPISNEVSLVVNADQQDLLNHGSSIVFDNRLLMTCQPRYDFEQTTHAAIVSLDFDLITGIRSKTPPAWEGIWTGLNIIQLLKYESRGAERAFLLAKSATTGNVEIWEISRDLPYDVPSIGVQSSIQWEVWTRSFNFSEPFSLKRLTGMELWCDDLQGSVTFTVDYKPDQSPSWQSWHSFTQCANVTLCSSTTSCIAITPNQPQYRTKMRLPKPPDACDAIISRPYYDLFEAQLRLQFTGHVRLRGLRINADERQENPNGECITTQDCTTLSVCPVNQFSYSIANGAANQSILGNGIPILTDAGLAIQYNT